MKKKSIFILGIIVGAILFGSIGVYATAKYVSKDISYTKKDGTTISVDNALSELYNKSDECIRGTYNHNAQSEWNINVGFVPNKFNLSLKTSINDVFFSYNNEISQEVPITAKNFDSNQWTSENYGSALTIGATIISKWGAGLLYNEQYDINYMICK